MDYTKDTSNFTKNSSQQQTKSRTDGYDSSLRQHMLSVYQQMFLALLITIGVAASVAYSNTMMMLVHGPMGIILMLATIALPLYFTFKINTISLSKARGILFTYAALMGATLSYTLAVFGPMTTLKALLSTTSMFGAMCIYGYTTKADLSRYSSIMFMALIGLIITGFINMFTQSTAMDLIISGAGVLIFAGITAYDTQRAKDVYFQTSHNNETRAKAAIFCALSLYMNFINMFIYMLRFINRTRD